MKKLFGKFSFWLAALVVLLSTSFVLLNVATSILGDRYSLSFDLTANSAYKLGRETKEVLANMDKNVNIYVMGNENYFSGNSYIVQAGKMISEYPKNSGHIKLSYIDYESDPSFAAAYPDLTLTAGDVLVTCGDKVKQIPVTSFFNYVYDYDGSFNIESSRAEEVMTSAILYVLNDDTVKVGLLTGNGVFDTSSLKTVLADNNFDVAEINMVSDSFDDCDILVLASPTIDISEEILARFDQFLKNNGQYGKHILYTTGAAQPELPDLEVFLNEWGVDIKGGTVFETSRERTYNYQPYYAIAGYEDNEITDRLRDTDSPMVMPIAKYTETLFEFKDNHYTETLLSFSDTAGIRPEDADDSFAARNATEWGPFPAMILCSYRVQDKETPEGYRQSSVVVSTSTHMLDASILQNSSLGDMEYLIDLFGYLTDREQTVTIAPKTLGGNALGISTSQVSALGVVLCIVIPVLILAAGIVIWLRRRFN